MDPFRGVSLNIFLIIPSQTYILPIFLSHITSFTSFIRPKFYFFFIFVLSQIIHLSQVGLLSFPTSTRARLVHYKLYRGSISVRRRRCRRDCSVGYTRSRRMLQMFPCRTTVSITRKSRPSTSATSTVYTSQPALSCRRCLFDYMINIPDYSVPNIYIPDCSVPNTTFYHFFLSQTTSLLYLLSRAPNLPFPLTFLTQIIYHHPTGLHFRGGRWSTGLGSALSSHR